MSMFADALKKVGFLHEEGPLPEDELEKIKLHAKQMLDGENIPENMAAEPSVSAPEVQTPENLPVEGLLTVEAVYREFNMANLDCSIFKVDDFLNALPDNLPTDVKKQSVLGILNATGLDAEKLLEDGRQRMDALGKTMDCFSSETENAIAEAEKEIESLQAKIDQQKQNINDRKMLQENQETLIHDETTRIQGILNFLG